MGKNKSSKVKNEEKVEIKENEIVYNALRAEIVSIEGLRRNMYLYMYSLFAALYGLGIQFGHHFFLLTYAILIPLQSKINFYSWSITKLATYIKVFFEDARNDIHWESVQTYKPLLDITNRKNHVLFGLGSHTSPVLLGAISTISFIWCSLIELPTLVCNIDKVLNILLSIFSLFLLVISLLLTIQAYKRSDDEAFEIISKYKSELEAGKTPKLLRTKK